MDLILRLKNAKTQLLEEAIGEFSNGVRPTRADLADLIEICASFPQDARQAWDAQVRRAAAQQIEDYQQAGEALLRFIEDQLRLLGSVERLARAVADEGVPTLGTAQLGKTRTDLEELRWFIRDRWAWPPTAEEREEARAAYGRGEFQSVQEVLRELQR